MCINFVIWLRHVIINAGLQPINYLHGVLKSTDLQMDYMVPWWVSMTVYMSSNMKLDFGITNNTCLDTSQYSYTSQIQDILQLFRTMSGQQIQKCKRLQHKTLWSLPFFCHLCYNNCPYLAGNLWKPSLVTLMTSSSACCASQETPENHHCPLLGYTCQNPCISNLLMPDTQKKCTRHAAAKLAWINMFCDVIKKGCVTVNWWISQRQLGFIRAIPR